MLRVFVTSSFKKTDEDEILVLIAPEREPSLTTMSSIGRAKP